MLLNLFLLTNIFFIFSNHPILSINIIIILVLLSMTLFSFFLKNSWFSLIFILMMLGGLIILFMYMASLASNEAFFLKTPNFLYFFFILITPLNSNLFFNSSSSFNLNYMFSSFLSFNIIIALIYLFFGLIFMLDFMQYIKSTLRSKFLSN
nr:NADH dehydrogenase subunit 6 [Hypoaspis sp. 3 JO-2023a]